MLVKYYLYLYIIFLPLIIEILLYLVYGNDLEKELMGETSGSFRRLLVSLCQVYYFINIYLEIFFLHNNIYFLTGTTQ